MSEYRRFFVPGGTYFFTVVTLDRRPILASDLGRRCLREVLRDVRADRPFDIVSIVLLPDHFHTIWALPPGDKDYSTRLRLVKGLFTKSYLSSGGKEGQLSESRESRKERAVWQRRFWEHSCRDEDDLKRCVDYIHWNPVKHGLVRRVADYKWSSFTRFRDLGEYETDWGGVNPCPGFDMPE